MVYPKFDGIKAYRCNKCALMFGIDSVLNQAYCPKCKGCTEIMGEGMIMFFPSHQKEEIVNNVSTNVGNISKYPDVLKAEHIAEILGCSKRIAYEMMDRRDFPLIRIGRLKRVNKNDFYKWLNENAY